MAEHGDKTEAPTPKKRQQARDQGNIARSPDLSAAVAVLGSMLLLRLTGPQIIEVLRALVAEGLSPTAGATGLAEPLPRALAGVALAVGPFMAGLAGLAIVVNAMQVGLQANTQRLAPNLNAINPIKGVGKLFGQGRGPAPIVMGLLKFALIALVGWHTVRSGIGTIASAQTLEIRGVFGLAAVMVYDLVLKLGAILLVLGILDYGWNWLRTERDLKMTRQEIRDEMRTMEGDPHIRMRRRQIASDMLRQRFRKEVPTADVVVTNPTEFAVALRYDPQTMHAPRVVAKGQGPLAKVIRDLAASHGVPILERKPLARALYRLVAIGQEIPEQFYATVAEILAYVYELSGKSRRQREPSVPREEVAAAV